MGRATVRAAVELGAEVVAARRRAVADALPAGRIGTPEDIVHAAMFLMTNRQTTGAVLELGGGEALVDRLG